MMPGVLAIVEIAGIRGSSSSLQSPSFLELNILVNICRSGRKQGSNELKLLTPVNRHCCSHVAGSWSGSYSMFEIGTLTHHLLRILVFN